MARAPLVWFARMRRFAALVLAITMVASNLSASSVRADDGAGAADQAAQEISAARDRADKAGQAYFDAESTIDQLDTQAQLLQGSVDALQRSVDSLEAKVEAIAINRYTSSGGSSLPLLTGFKSAADQVEINALIDVVNSTSADDFDRFHTITLDLGAKQQQLAAKLAEAKTHKNQLAQLRQAAIDEVANLKTVEAGRLKDEAVRSALAALEVRKLHDASTQQKAAEATPSTSIGSPDPLAAGAGANADDAGSASALPTDGSVTGGKTGNGGSGVGVAIGGNGGDYGGPNWVCPTGTAPMAFSDTWGAPRSGGRRHQGVDLIGARGSPVLAVVDGVAVGNQNELGGTTISLTGTDGNRYYYAHLDGYVTLGQVTAGTVIGILGQSGNAQFSVPHVHFEIHPGGGPAVDPYPTARAHCP
jgi:murein DD-endopeptidase MepM/ murein hydrolase activator NlpD